MITLQTRNPKEIIRSKKLLENKLGGKITIKGKMLFIDADSMNEFEAQRVIDAINLGFSSEDAVLVIEDDIAFEKINLKDYANTTNLEVVRSRLIGTKGKTKDTIEEITKCKVRLYNNVVGVIGPAIIVENARTAVTSIIKGTKQANAYKYLERINRGRREEINPNSKKRKF